MYVYVYIYIYFDVVGYYGDIMGYMYITTQLDMDSFCVLKGGGFAQCVAFSIRNSMFKPLDFGGV